MSGSAALGSATLPCVSASPDANQPRRLPRHNARSWKSWDFSHDRQTKYPLDGAHLKISCYACHRAPVEERATLPTNCVSCHAAEDVHDGTYGKQCEKCHVTSSFKQIRRGL